MYLFENMSIERHPYPHGFSLNALPDDEYHALYDSRPDWRVIAGSRAGEDNVRIDWGALECLASDQISDVWKEFITRHVSPKCWLAFVKKWGDTIRLAYPWLESYHGKRLEDFDVLPRGINDWADIYLDCQIGINTPTSGNKSVIGAHLDNPTELYGSLLYMRDPEDVASAGDFWIGRLPPIIKVNGKRLVDYGCVPHRTVAYQANTYAGFINTAHSIHGVTTRHASDKPRLLVNFSVEFDKNKLKLFDPELYRGD